MTFAPVELPVLDGGLFRLGDASFPCLVNFWATWCPPCRAEMASLNRLHRDFASRGLGIYAVSVDEDTHLVREYVRQSPLEFAVLLDSGGKLASRIGIAAYPTTLLLDRSARVSSIWVGERNWDAAEIRATIDRAVGR
jgi:thiol-disulfide isomerase/thioredoxin